MKYAFLISIFCFSGVAMAAKLSPTYCYQMYSHLRGVSQAFPITEDNIDDIKQRELDWGLFSIFETLHKLCDESSQKPSAVPAYSICTNGVSITDSEAISKPELAQELKQVLSDISNVCKIMDDITNP